MNPIPLVVLLMALQTPVSGRLPLQGRVVRSDTNDPIARASVVVAKVGGQIEDYRTSLTDEAGRFAFSDLIPGTYRVFATRTGYLPSEYGQRESSDWSRFVGGTRITLPDAQPRRDLALSMIPAGAIVGRVRDSEGTPLRNVWVRVLRAVYRNGNRQLDMVESAQTNDIGDYRVFDLPPGQYFISGSLDLPRVEGDSYRAPAIPIQISESDRGYRFQTTMPGATALSQGLVSATAFDHRVIFPVYFPNTRNEAEAGSLELRAGATLAGIDLILAAIPTMHVRGRVLNGVTGEPVPNTLITIPPLTSVRSGATGLFDIPGVPAGRYELWTSAWPTPLQGTTKIEVEDRDLESVALVLQPTVNVTGRIKVDGRSLTPNDPTFSVGFLTPPGRTGIGGAIVQPDGTFTISNVGKGDFQLRVSGRNAFVKSARFGAADVLNSPVHIDSDTQGQVLEINMSLKTGVVEARVVNDTQQSVQGASVVIVPDPSRRSRSELYKEARSDSSGRVRFEGVAPGEYKLFASQNVTLTDWQSPSVISLYESRGELVRIEENGRQEVTLKAITSRP